MKIVVCMKQVPSSEARIALAPDGVSINTADVEMEINPYDEYAVEEALQIVETRGEGEVIILTIGPDKAIESIRKCLAMGADRAILVKDEAYHGGDCLGNAKIMADIIKGIEPDLVLTGKLSIDVENDGTGVAMAEYLGWPHVTFVRKLEWTDNNTAKAIRNIEGGAELVEVTMPAVLTAEKGLNEPRYPKLKGVMQAKRKPLDEVTPSMAAAEVGAAAAKVTVVSLSPPPARAGGQKFEGEISEIIPKVVELLKSEAKVF